MLRTAPTYHVGSYGAVIHEMAEMHLAANKPQHKRNRLQLGQYAHSNQPVHHCLFLYAATGGVPLLHKTQYWVRRVLQECYSNEPDGLPGDEDNGEMSAWYVFGALGFYPLCPGHPSYVIGSPLFERIEVRLGLGLGEGQQQEQEQERVLVVEGVGNSESNVYSKEVTWKGKEQRSKSEANRGGSSGGCSNKVSGVSLSHRQLIEGGTLRFTMTGDENETPGGTRATCTNKVDKGNRSKGKIEHKHGHPPKKQDINKIAVSSANASHAKLDMHDGDGGLAFSLSLSL